MAINDRHNLKLVDIAVFNKVAATLSMTRAGDLLNLSRSAVSKRLSRLEENAGIQLLHRNVRTIQLTDAGERLYDQTARLEEIVAHAHDVIRDAGATPYGRLSFTLPTSLGASLLPLILREFRAAWPDLQLNISLDDQNLNLVDNGFDVAIRVAKRLPDAGLPARRLATTPEILLASPGYLETYGRPAHVRELEQHRCLTLHNRNAVWRFVHKKEGLSNVRLGHATTINNDLALILTACLDGGIIRVPRLLVESEIQRGRLEFILHSFRATHEYSVYAVYPKANLPHSVRLFIEFVEFWLPRLGELDRWNPLGTQNAD